MSDSNSFEDNEGRSSPSPPPHHLGHVLQGSEGGSVDEENSMDTDHHHHHGVHGGHSELIITQHSHLDGEAEDDDDDEIEMSGGKKGKGDKPQGKAKKKTGGSGRRRIEIKFIENKSRRQVTFSRRKRGLMKKAYELTTLTGTQALVLIASETGHVYTFATPKLQPVVTLREGKELIQSCLNAPDNNYPPSDFLPNTNSGGGNGGNGGGNGSGASSPQSGHQNPKSEPHSSPQLPHSQHLPLQHPQHQSHMGHQSHQQMPPQHASHPQHQPHHDPMLNLYGNGPHGVTHGSPYSPHMSPSYPPHDLYLTQGQALPPMSLGQHGLPHHVDPSKGRDHHLQ